MKLPVIYVYTHDSIGVGEDGPTHQPVEHISMLRITPAFILGDLVMGLKLLVRGNLRWSQNLHLQH